MGCMTIRAGRIGNGIEVSAGRLGLCPAIRAGRIGNGIEVSAGRLGLCPAIRAGRIGNGIEVRCSMICSVGVSLYLEVTPEVLWLVDDEGIFNVESNTEWKVE